MHSDNPCMTRSRALTRSTLWRSLMKPTFGKTLTIVVPVAVLLAAPTVVVWWWPGTGSLRGHELVIARFNALRNLLTLWVDELPAQVFGIVGIVVVSITVWELRGRPRDWFGATTRLDFHELKTLYLNGDSVILEHREHAIALLGDAGISKNQAVSVLTALRRRRRLRTYDVWAASSVYALGIFAVVIVGEDAVPPDTVIAFFAIQFSSILVPIYIHRRSFQYSIDTILTLSAGAIIRLQLQLIISSTETEMSGSNAATGYSQMTNRSRYLQTVAVRIVREVGFLTKGQRVAQPNNGFGRAIYSAATHPIDSKRLSTAITACAQLIKGLLEGHPANFDGVLFPTDAPSLPTGLRPLDIVKNVFSLPVVLALLPVIATVMFGLLFGGKF